MYYRTICLKVLINILFVLLCIISTPLLILLLVVYPINKRIPIYIISFISKVLWTLHNYIFKLTFNIKIKGLSTIERNKSYIVVMNHIGAFDYMIVHDVARQFNMLSMCKFILKQQLLYIPIIGLGMKIGGHCFINRTSTDYYIIKKWADMYNNLNINFWTILYPEGTRLTVKNKKKSDEFCEKNNLKKMEYTLYPRKRGYNIVTDVLKQDVISISVDYNMGLTKVPGFLKVLFGPKINDKILINIKVHKQKTVEDIFYGINNDIKYNRKN